MKFVVAHIVILTKCLRCAQNKEFSESLAQDCSHQTAEPGKMYMAHEKVFKKWCNSCLWYQNIRYRKNLVLEINEIH